MTDEPGPTALFVDFDSVFTSLPSAAGDAFATRPEDWLRYFEAVRHDPAGRRRRILLRHCYLNAAGFLPKKGAWRPFHRPEASRAA